MIRYLIRSCFLAHSFEREICSACLIAFHAVFMSTQAFMLCPSSWNVRWLIILFWFTEQILSQQQCILAQKAVPEAWHVICGFVQSNYCHFHQCFCDIDMHRLRKITKATEVAARQLFHHFWLGNYLKDAIELVGSDKHHQSIKNMFSIISAHIQVLF